MFAMPVGSLVLCLEIIVITCALAFSPLHGNNFVILFHLISLFLPGSVPVL